MFIGLQTLRFTSFEFITLSFLLMSDFHTVNCASALLYLELSLCVLSVNSLALIGLFGVLFVVCAPFSCDFNQTIALAYRGLCSICSASLNPSCYHHHLYNYWASHSSVQLPRYQCVRLGRPGAAHQHQRQRKYSASAETFSTFSLFSARF